MTNKEYILEIISYVNKEHAMTKYMNDFIAKIIKPPYTKEYQILCNAIFCFITSPPEIVQENKENKDNKENKKEEGFDFLKSIIDLGVDEQVANDWMVVRKKKGASNTPTAFNRIKKEIEACSATPNECITLVAENSWRGFEARYFTDNNASSSKQEEVSADEKALAENWKIINGGTYLWRGLTKTKTWIYDYELKDLPDNNKI